MVVHNLWLLLVSLLIGLFLVYKTKTLGLFIISLIILSSLFFVLFKFVLNAFKYFKLKKRSDFMLYLFLSILLVCVIFLAWLFIIANFGAGPTRLTVVDNPDFYRNIFTRECEFRGYGSGYASPWYINRGCDLEKGDLLALVKESNKYSYIVDVCNSFCNSSYDYAVEQFCAANFFGSSRVSSINELNCGDVVVCEVIDCLNR